MSVRLSGHMGTTWLSLDGFPWILSTFRNLSRKLKFYQKRRRISGTLQEEDQYNLIFFIISRSFLLRIKNVSDKSCRENQNTHFMCNNFFLENRVIYEIMWKNVKPDRPQMTIWRMRVAWWIPKTTNRHSEYIILIAFPLQQ